MKYNVPSICELSFHFFLVLLELWVKGVKVDGGGKLKSERE
jgi:hypothetical protein